MVKKEQKLLELTQYLAGLEHPLKDLVFALHEIMLTSHPSISGQVKWNSPAYYYQDKQIIQPNKDYTLDFMVMHLRKPSEVLLIFPNGKLIPNATDILEDHFPKDKRLGLRLKTLSDLADAQPKLLKVIESYVGWARGYVIKN